MGFFRKLGKAIEGAVELADGDSYGTDARADKPPVAIRTDASSLADLQLLAATSNGRLGRATVQWTEGVSAVEEGNADGYCTVQMGVRVRELDGGFGPCVAKRVLLPRDAGLVIGAGLEVPITRDPATGALEGIDRKALVEELRPLFAEARAEEAARRSVGLGVVATALREGLNDLRQPATVPEPSATVEGVTADQWLQARRVLAAGRIPPAVLDRTLAAYKIPAGRWPQIDAEWSARAAADPALAARLANL
ncbi:MAG: hypothetical protein Q7V88_07045 [Actinomycetota bacterium]|nr:hypothetical protein [Actinomycetota bacterium]